MTYVSQWERLADALARVVAATKLSPEEARIDICRAIADGSVRLRAQLKNKGPLTSKETLAGDAFELAHAIQPEEFDWEQSCPRRAWRLKSPHRYHGLWQLRWIELSVPDLIRIFGSSPKRAMAAGTPQRPATKGQPAFDCAKRAIDALWPGGPPDPATLHNKQLVAMVQDKLKELGLRRVSRDTILRAAERRK